MADHHSAGAAGRTQAKLPFLVLAVTLAFAGLLRPLPVLAIDHPGSNLSGLTEADVPGLVAAMTLAEKVGQLVQTDVAVASPDDVREYYLGSVISLIPDGKLGEPALWRERADAYQRAALSTRLGIPVVFGIDAVHGHSYFDGPSVILPHNIGIGATRNPVLAEQLAAVTATELLATGVRWTFSPSIAVARDIRWGRAFESFGEDVSLQRMFAAPLVRGYQGSETAPFRVGATVKHFIADGATDGGVDRGNATISGEELRRLHLPGFVDAIEAGAVSVMASFSSVNGEKVHGSKMLLTDLLKQELGFDGVVVTDWEGVTLSGLSLKEGLDAGIDMFMFAESWKKSLPELLQAAEAGEVSMARIDDAVSRILRMKIRLGLFASPFTSDAWDAQLGSDAHRKVARQAVRESLVLLKNASGLLPLDKSSRVIVAGSHADNVAFQCGGWTKKWQGAHLDRFGHAARPVDGATSILEGIRKLIGVERVVTNPAIDTDAEVAIVVVGEEPYAEMFGDRAAEELVLTPEQKSLIRTLHQRGKKVVTVLISGRPLLIEEELALSDAVVAAWLPGSEGAGIADVLFGDYGFSGRLGFSWPAAAGQLPINVGDATYEPRFEFGYGLKTQPHARVLK